MTTFEGQLRELILRYFGRELGGLKEVIMVGEKCTYKTVYSELDAAPFCQGCRSSAGRRS